MIFNVAQSPINWQLLILPVHACSEDHYLRYDSRLCTARRAPFRLGLARSSSGAHAGTCALEVEPRYWAPELNSEVAAAAPRRHFERPEWRQCEAVTGITKSANYPFRTSTCSRYRIWVQTRDFVQALADGRARRALRQASSQRLQASAQNRQWRCVSALARHSAPQAAATSAQASI